MRLTCRRLRWPLVGILCLALGAWTAIGAVSALGDSPGYDISGTWNCCGSGGAAEQTFDITEDDSSGALSGSATSGGSVFASISGSVSGSDVTITTTYTTDAGYVATFTGSVTDGTDMSGDWSSNAGQSGTWSATLASGMATTLSTTTATTTTTTAKYPTGTEVSCYDEMPGDPGDYDQCTATVGGTDTANTAIVPGGDVTFSVNSGGSGAFPDGNTCTLQPSQDGGNTSFCAVNYSPAAPVGTEPPITAVYGGDANFSSSSGSPALEGAPDTTTDSTPTDTTPTDTTATTDTTTTDCSGTADSVSANLRRAHCSANSQKAAALLQQIQALDAQIASITAKLAKVDPDPDGFGVTGTGLSSGIGIGAELLTATGKVLNAVAAVTGLGTSVAPASLQADLQAAQSQRAALQAQLDALLAPATGSKRRSGASTNVGQIAKPVAIKLTLPAQAGRAGAVLTADATVVEYQRVCATTLARAQEAAADSLRADAAKQWHALAGYDISEAQALKRLGTAERALIAGRSRR